MYRSLTNRQIGWLGLAALAAGVVLAGCGGSEFQLAPAKGKVTYKGKPLEFGTVIFIPEKGPAAIGQIQSDGTFVLETGTQSGRMRKGAVVGKHKVEIRCLETQRPGYKPPADQEMPAGKSLIPTKYNQADTSGLTAEVTAKGPNEFTFDLKD
ncbi:MAG: hypothetical protein NZ602_09605 [Thermoguttaceae bacterium]|nr:hypothetical protein [Thermoguttaceae bacterium]MDW8038730.1 hypothetical protein [Thermoguttaceae bacterium]